MKKSERTRLHITSQAALLFNRQGFAGTSMDDILSATGLSKGAVYGHFKNKEEVAIAAFKHAVSAIIEALRKRTVVIDNSVDKLKTVVYFYKENILTPPLQYGCPILNTATETSDHHLNIRRNVRDAMDHWQERLVRLIEKGIKKGELRPDACPKTFAVQFIGMLEGAILLTQLYKDRSYFDTITPQLLALIEELAI